MRRCAGYRFRLTLSLQGCAPPQGGSSDLHWILVWNGFYELCSTDLCSSLNCHSSACYAQQLLKTRNCLFWKSTPGSQQALRERVENWNGLGRLSSCHSKCSGSSTVIKFTGYGFRNVTGKVAPYLDFIMVYSEGLVFLAVGCDVNDLSFN